MSFRILSFWLLLISSCGDVALAHNRLTRQTATYAFGYDTGKLGVRTLANLSGNLLNTWSGGTPDVLGRLAGESLSLTSGMFTARGRALGALSVVLNLNGNSQPVSYSPAQPEGLWESAISYGFGSHTLIATATHPFNGGTGGTNLLRRATNTFTASGTGTIAVTYDAHGDVLTRIWGGSNARKQNLEWDELGRLSRVTELYGTTTNLVWSALYDGLNRRLRVTEIRYGGTPPLMSLVESWYDPQAEFLEAAVSYNGERWWNLTGPDLNGSYGGHQGIGGLEGAIRERDGATEGLLTDYFGHGVGTIAGTTVSWSGSQLSGYGIVQGFEAPKLGYYVSPMKAAGYRSRRTDATGLMQFGLRPYDALEGRFLSPDPLGNAGSWSLYDYANNDPVNGLDADGRLGAKSVSVGSQNAPPSYELGVAPVMSETWFRQTIFNNGTQTEFDAVGSSQLYAPEDVFGFKYAIKREQTGEYFGYVRDTHDGGPLADPDYGRPSFNTVNVREIEERRNLEAMVWAASVAFDAATFLEGGAAIAGLRGGLKNAAKSSTVRIASSGGGSWAGAAPLNARVASLQEALLSEGRVAFTRADRLTLRELGNVASGLEREVAITRIGQTRYLNLSGTYGGSLQLQAGERLIGHFHPGLGSSGLGYGSFIQDFGFMSDARIARQAVFNEAGAFRFIGSGGTAGGSIFNAPGWP